MPNNNTTRTGSDNSGVSIDIPFLQLFSFSTYCRSLFYTPSVMNKIKAIIAILIGTVAFIVLLAEIDACALVFFAIKIGCLAIIAWSVRAIKESSIIDIDE